MMIRKIFLLAFVFCLLFSCKDYEDSDENSADIVLKDAVYVFKNNDNPIKISAKKIELWTKKNITSISDMIFTQVDEITNEVLMSGKAGKAEIKDRSQLADMQGDVEIKIFKDNKTSIIKADKLKFDNRSGDISADGDLLFDYDGSIIQGVGFKGNTKSGNYSFQKVINGSL